MNTCWQDISAVLTALANLIIILGIIFAATQANAAKNSLRAQVLMKLHDEWRNNEFYKSIQYIHSLRQQWKTQNQHASQWNRLAETWVNEHAGDLNNSALSVEWQMRRTASQFLAKMSVLIDSKYLSAAEFFQTVPEAGRILAVLIPIEVAITKYWQEHEKGEPIAEWDIPIPKWEFTNLWKNYLRWVTNHSDEMTLKDIDWSKVATRTK